MNTKDPTQVKEVSLREKNAKGFVFDSSDNCEKRKREVELLVVGRRMYLLGLGKERLKSAGNSRAVKVKKKMRQSVDDVIYYKSIQGELVIPLQDVPLVSEKCIDGDSGMESVIADLTI